MCDPKNAETEIFKIKTKKHKFLNQNAEINIFSVPIPKIQKFSRKFQAKKVKRFHFSDNFFTFTSFLDNIDNIIYQSHIKLISFDGVF